MKKSLLILLTIFSLSACSNTEFVHVRVWCLGQPNASLGFTKGESEAIPESAKKKIVIFAKTLRARIDAQCEINYKHDEMHEAKR